MEGNFLGSCRMATFRISDIESSGTSAILLGLCTILQSNSNVSFWMFLCLLEMPRKAVIIPHIGILKTINFNIF